MIDVHPAAIYLTLILYGLGVLVIGKLAQRVEALQTELDAEKDRFNLYREIMAKPEAEETNAKRAQGLNVTWHTGVAVHQPSMSLGASTVQTTARTLIK